MASASSTAQPTRDAGRRPDCHYSQAFSGEFDAIGGMKPIHGRDRRLIWCDFARPSTTNNARRCRVSPAEEASKLLMTLYYVLTRLT